MSNRHGDSADVGRVWTSGTDWPWQGRKRMDGQWFDVLAKNLAGLTTRRGVLKGLTGSAAGGLLALVGLGSAEADVCKPTGKECKKDGQCCSGSCVPPTHSQST